MPFDAKMFSNFDIDNAILYKTFKKHFKSKHYFQVEIQKRKSNFDKITLIGFRKN